MADVGGGATAYAADAGLHGFGTGGSDVRSDDEDVSEEEAALRSAYAHVATTPTGLT